MLHIRVVSPPSVTGSLVEHLTTAAGVLNLVVMRGAAVPAGDAASSGDAVSPGDAVQFDVQVGAANAVLEELQRFGLHRERPISIASVYAAIVDVAPRPDWRRMYHAERAPVWDVVEARIAEEASYAPSFFALLVFAGLIGACGILTNSQILIVGAMVVGPEYSAIISVALGIERRNWHAVRSGLLALLAGFLLAIFVTLLFALCIRGLGKAPELYLHGIRPVSDLINSPNLFSVVVAVAAGIVGVVSLTLARAGALIGVFISITTIPAAADIAVSVAFGGWKEARGSTVQLLLNVGLLIAIGAAALRAQRMIWKRATSARPVP
jgi:uncharacterized hydrophobic protein (TIGR00271 family)